MSTAATGQLFGYSLQFPRALLRLLQADSGVRVGIEICGDVAVFFPGGAILSEEDKSSLNDNPIADHSSNLWKTFFNWINAIGKNELAADRDKFVLYSNYPVSEESLVYLFHNAKNEQLVDEAFAQAKLRLKDVGEQHSIFKFTDVVLNKNSDVFKQIINHFELVINYRSDDVYNEIRQELEKKAFTKNEVENLLDSLTGWTQKMIMQKIASKVPAILGADEIMAQIRLLGGKIRRKELIDLSLSKMSSIPTLEQETKHNRAYVRQLEHIEADDEKIMEAVSDYFRAHVNRNAWIEQEIVDEADMSDFEGRLCSFHKSKHDQIELTYTSLPEEKRGQLLLSECQIRQEQIGGQSPPDRTISGSYHVLADEKRLGWHPRWNILLKNDKKGGQDGKAS